MKRLFRGRTPKLHFIGIGGIGMSGIAEILLGHGYSVSGSDTSTTPVTERLGRLGAKIFPAHDPENIKGAEIIVVSTAIRDDNPEILAAKGAKIPIVHRGEMLAELMRLNMGIAIAGSHGKTSTTSLVAHVLQTAKLDPTAVVGGVVKNFGSNAKQGMGEYLVAEADESDGSFLQLFPTIAVVTNIDPEHLEHYPDGFPQLLGAFNSFINNLPFYGLAILCSDHPNVRALLPSIRKRYVTYGLQGGDYTLRDLETSQEGVSFVPVRRGEPLPRVHFPMIGAHYAQNALAVLALADDLGIAYSDYQSALATFEGVGRRFELKGEAKGIAVYDDYGHHPAEVEATLRGAKRSFERRVVVVFQPHRYSRTRDLLAEFSSCFEDADVVVLTDIYAAGEEPLPGITGRTIVDQVRAHGHGDVHYVEQKSMLPEFLRDIVKEGDLVLTLGAGDIWKAGDRLLDLLRGMP
jgi:UDP-N-acetylmuramate--alanine ligase